VLVRPGEDDERDGRERARRGAGEKRPVGALEEGPFERQEPHREELWTKRGSRGHRGERQHERRRDGRRMDRVAEPARPHRRARGVEDARDDPRADRELEREQARPAGDAENGREHHLGQPLVVEEGVAVGAVRPVIDAWDAERAERELAAVEMIPEVLVGESPTPRVREGRDDEQQRYAAHHARLVRWGGLGHDRFRSARVVPARPARSLARRAFRAGVVSTR
jgi:hypothetical protein